MRRLELGTISLAILTIFCPFTDETVYISSPFATKSSAGGVRALFRGGLNMPHSRCCPSNNVGRV
jgi:hypothetical protein